MYAHENWVTEFQTVQFFLQTQISVVHTLCMNITGKQIQDTYVFWRSFEVLKKKKRVSWTTQPAILPTSHCLRLCHRFPQRSLERWCFYLGTSSPWTKPEPREEGGFVKRILCRRLLPRWITPPLPRGREGSCSLAQASWEGQGRRTKWILHRQLTVFATVAIKIKIDYTYRAPSTMSGTLWSSSESQPLKKLSPVI